MEPRRFDALTRALSTPGSRRRALASLLGSALGLLAVGLGSSPDASAKKKRKKNRRRKDREVKAEGPCGNGKPKKNRCKRDRQCCTKYCKKRRCRCRKPGQSCTEDRNCCPERTGRTCIDGSCQAAPTCAGQGAACPGDLPCCAGLRCDDGACQPPPTCLGPGDDCPGELDCCAGLSCQDNTCQPVPTCLSQDEACPGDLPCCDGLSCQTGVCQPACAATCSGCCVGEDCREGTSPAECGVGGNPCQVCEAGKVCPEGICSEPCGDVCANGCRYQTIQEAIDDPDGPDTIHLCAGTYLETISIDKNLTLIGAGQGTDGTVLDGQADLEMNSVVTVDAGATVELKGLRITGASRIVGNGGGVDNIGTLTLTDCTVTDNGAPNGGGIYNEFGGDLTLTRCTVTLNRANQGAGIYNNSPNTVHIIDSVVTENEAFAVDGGGIFNNGFVTFGGDSSVANNTGGNCKGPGTYTDPVDACDD